MWESKDVAAIATGLSRRSENPKTGNEIQTWVLPTAGVSRDARHACCGDCPLRTCGACYVTWIQSASSIHAAWQRGSYVDSRPEYFSGRVVRISSAGDPAFVPVSVWENVLGSAKAWTGYTHQWRRPSAQHLRRWCMASVEFDWQVDEANAMGWRTFRAKAPWQPVRADETYCHSAGGATCGECRLCSGIIGGNGNVCINVHGRQACHHPAMQF
jgi:hypothetical protein